MKFNILSATLLAGLGSACPLPPNSTDSATPKPTGTLTAPRNSTIPEPSRGGNGGNGAAQGLIGYGAQTTGGAGGAETTVSSCAELETAVTGDAAKIVKIDGMLTGCGVIDIGSNTSVLGIGSESGLKDSGLRIKGVSNVIIQNLKLGPATAQGDVIAVNSSTNVWIDHNEFKSLGLVGSKDDFDGLLDITHGADLVTISYNTFADHWKGLLFGHSDSNAAEDTGKLRVTIHHNTFTTLNSRMPSIRFGTVHVFNNVFKDVATSGINSRMGAQVLVENNIFENVKLAMVTDLDSEEPGNICSNGNSLTGTSTERITSKCNLTPPYEYTLDAVDGLESTLTSEAGVAA